MPRWTTTIASRNDRRIQKQRKTHMDFYKTNPFRATESGRAKYFPARSRSEAGGAVGWFELEWPGVGFYARNQQRINLDRLQLLRDSRAGNHEAPLEPNLKRLTGSFVGTENTYSPSPRAVFFPRTGRPIADLFPLFPAADPGPLRSG
jgi:hypothetical protein